VLQKEHLWELVPIRLAQHLLFLLREQRITAVAPFTITLGCDAVDESVAGRPCDPRPAPFHNPQRFISCPSQLYRLPELHRLFVSINSAQRWKKKSEPKTQALAKPRPTQRVYLRTSRDICSAPCSSEIKLIISAGLYSWPFLVGYAITFSSLPTHTRSISLSLPSGMTKSAAKPILLGTARISTHLLVQTQILTLIPNLRLKMRRTMKITMTMTPTP
jgi:hypothetical protein